MKINTIDKLAPYLLEDTTETTPHNSYYSYFPPEYIKFIETYNGKIGFNNGAILNSPQHIPQTNGIIRVDYLYGASSGLYGLNYNIESAFNIMPSRDYLTFGECPGGDKVCLNKNSGHVYFFWHDAPTDDECFYLLSNDIFEFMNTITQEDKVIIENKKNVKITLFPRLQKVINQSKHNT